jgi:predicted nucleic acid-binding protein
LRKGHLRTVDGGDPSRLFVDSGGWIALVSAGDGHHAEADQMFRAAVARRLHLFTTNLVVAEVHCFILFRAGIRPAAAVLDRINASRLVSIEFVSAAHHRAARAWLERLRDQVITYTDAVSFAVMDAARCGVAISFDHDFISAGFRLWHA